MSGYTLTQISPADRRMTAQLDQLLKGEEISRDANLDYTAGLLDDDYNLIATGSCYGNTLRCLAVSSAYQGEGLMGEIVSHLMEYQMERGNAHLFLYTKCDKAHFFEDLGFYEIARVEGKVAFLENRRNGFSGFSRELEKRRGEGTSAALVMNCNPFTLGHRHLVERAAGENDWVHLFVVSEDASLFPFAHRYALVEAGCRGLENVILHETKSYMISNAVFPSYFLPDEKSVIEAHARLDLALFRQIAAAVGVSRRYVAEEPFSRVTSQYNRIMAEELPKAGIECVIIPRLALEEEPISASHVRRLLHAGRLEETRGLVPQSTYDYFFTPEGEETLRRIRQAEVVEHY